MKIHAPVPTSANLRDGNHCMYAGARAREESLLMHARMCARTHMHVCKAQWKPPRRFAAVTASSRCESCAFEWKRFVASVYKIVLYV